MSERKFSGLDRHLAKLRYRGGPGAISPASVRKASVTRDQSQSRRPAPSLAKFSIQEEKTE